MKVEVRGSDGWAIRPMVHVAPTYTFQTRLRVRWFMVSGYASLLALSWFAGQAFRTSDWVGFTLLVIAVTVLGCMLTAGRRR